MNQEVEQILNKAIAGTIITSDELLLLLQQEPESREAFAIWQAARKIGMESSKGMAEVHAQVGVNAGPCSKNCQFCSFAPINDVFPEEKRYSAEEIVERALRFETDGANAIYLMITADYPFELFLAVSRAVRKALKPESIMVANVGDFGNAEAKQLKEAGYAGIYHVWRMGEGETTEIDPAIRKETMLAAKRNGLKVGTCIEPCGPEHSLTEIVKRAVFLRDEIKPVHTGCGRRLPIPTSPLKDLGILDKLAQALRMAATRVFFGYEIPWHAGDHSILGGVTGCNLSWAESGSNPRDTKADTVIGATVATRTEAFEETGWKVVKGPSIMFGCK